MEVIEILNKLKIVVRILFVFLAWTLFIKLKDIEYNIILKTKNSLSTRDDHRIKIPITNDNYLK